VLRAVRDVQHSHHPLRLCAHALENALGMTVRAEVQEHPEGHTASTRGTYAAPHLEARHPRREAKPGAEAGALD